MQRSFRHTALSCAFITAAGCSSQHMQRLNSVGKDYDMAVLCGVGVIGGAAAGYALKGEDDVLAGCAVGGSSGPIT